MRSGAVRFILVGLVLLTVVFLPGSSLFLSCLQAEGLPAAQTALSSPEVSASSKNGSPFGDEEAKKRNELLKRETAVSLKEQELKKLSDSLAVRIQQLQQARKEIEASLERKKAEDEAKFKKILKVYKSLRPEEAAALMDKLDEDMALELLNRMDTKTAVNLIPYLNQKRVLKWTRLSLMQN
jgi:flagellar protein FlbB